MEWTMIADGRLKAYAYDDEGNDWSISFDGYADCEAPLAGDGVVLTRNDERVAAVAVEYYGADAEAAGYDMDALIAGVVEAVKALAETLAAGAKGEAEGDGGVSFDANEIKISERSVDNWVSGSLDGYTFEAKVFDEPSIYGISTPRFEDGGNVSKLSVRDDSGREVFLFDRGCYNGMVLHYAEAAAEIVAELEAKFCKAGE